MLSNRACQASQLSQNVKNCVVPRVPTWGLYPRHDYPYSLSYIRFFDFWATLTLAIERRHSLCTNHLSVFCISSQSTQRVDCHCNAVFSVTPGLCPREVSDCPATSMEFRFLALSLPPKTFRSFELSLSYHIDPPLSRGFCDFLGIFLPGFRYWSKAAGLAWFTSYNQVRT